MGYSFKMYGLSNLIKDMRKHDQDIDEFSFTYNKVVFTAIIDISNVPFQMLLGTKLKNWACVLNLEIGYSVTMDGDDFSRLCSILNLKPGKGSFTTFMFFSYINSHAPSACSLKPVQPSHIMPFRKKYITRADEPDKDIFLGWNDHVRDKKRAQNFSKTELFLGKKVADYCRKHNISSRWTTPDKAKEKPVSYPGGFKLK